MGGEGLGVDYLPPFFREREGRKHWHVLRSRRITGAPRKGGGNVTGNIYEKVYTGMGYEEKEKQKREYKSSVGKPPVVREQHHR